LEAEGLAEAEDEAEDEDDAEGDRLPLGDNEDELLPEGL